MLPFLLRNSQILLGVIYQDDGHFRICLYRRGHKIAAVYMEDPVLQNENIGTNVVDLIDRGNGGQLNTQQKPLFIPRNGFPKSQRFDIGFHDGKYTRHIASP